MLSQRSKSHVYVYFMEAKRGSAVQNRNMGYHLMHPIIFHAQYATSFSIRHSPIGTYKYAHCYKFLKLG